MIARLPEQGPRTATVGFGGRGRACIIDEGTVMRTRQTSRKVPSFKTAPAGMVWSSHDHDVIRRGTVTGVRKHGTTAANTVLVASRFCFHVRPETVAAELERDPGLDFSPSLLFNNAPAQNQQARAARHYEG